MQTISQSQKHTPDQAAAALALATHLSQMSQGVQPQPVQPTPEAPQMAPGGAQQPEPAEPFDNTKNEAKMTAIEASMKQMKTELESSMKSEISSIKDIIIEALKDDKKEDGKE